MGGNRTSSQKSTKATSANAAPAHQTACQPAAACKPGAILNIIRLPSGTQVPHTPIGPPRFSGGNQIEISAADVRGPRVLANFPVYCGVAPPATFAAVTNAEAHSLSPAQAEAQLLTQLDRDRTANGLPVLVHDPRLADIARRYSGEMAETGEVAHFSRRTGSVVDRVTAAKIAPSPRIIAENVGSAQSAADAERGFMASPGHRDNILNRAITHVGVGVAVGREESGSVPLYFTQVFAGWGQ